MKKTIFSLIFAILVFSSNAQEDPFQKVHDLYQNCQYKEALEKARLHEKANSGSAYFYITLSLVEMDAVFYKDTIITYLEKYVSDAANSGSFLEAYFGDLLKDKRGEKIKQKSYENFCKNNPALKYPEVTYAIYEIYKKDQWYRGRGIWNYKCMKSRDSLYSIRQNQYDSTNLIAIEKIVDQYGWPTDDVFGKNASFFSFFVIQHSTLEKQEKYMNLMDSLAKQKRIDPWDFFMLKDRILCSKGEKQIFGTQSYYENGEKKHYPKVDDETMERIMLEYGVTPKKRNNSK